MTQNSTHRTVLYFGRISKPNIIDSDVEIWRLVELDEARNCMALDVPHIIATMSNLIHVEAHGSH